jgi:hypothetical protein
MKSQKIAGIRLINYINDGINWKDHKDIVLDFWISKKSSDFGYHPKQFENMFYANELPTEIQTVYEDWFNEYDFNNSDDDWITFVNGTLNVFYHTSDPTQMPDDTWYVMLMQSEIKAREICEEQVFHGNPNINTFWKIDTNSKYEEVSGRRNGYLYVNELKNISNIDTRGFYWGVAFQCPESVKLFYEDGDERKSRCICWAADCKNATLLQINASGRFQVVQVEVKGKSWRPDKSIPANNSICRKAYVGHALDIELSNNYESLYGVWDEIEAEIKSEREAINQRKNAVNIMNDEEVDIGKIVNVDVFVIDGNVPEYERKRNQAIRKKIIKRNQLRERNIKKKMRDIERNEGKVNRRARNSLNPLLSKK